MNENPNAVINVEPAAPGRQEGEARLRRPSLWFRARHGLPTVFVVAALGALAYWGHHTGWTLPAFATLTGQEQGEKDDWCDAHGVPESECVECNPDLLPKAKEYGWCKTHGVPDCPFEHPEVAQLKNKPLVTPADLERAERALTLLPRPENNSKCKLHQRRIQFASKEAVEKAGIDVKRVEQAPVTEHVSANGEVTYDQTRVARLSARVPGTAWWVLKQVGDEVRRGDVLALVDAAEVGKAKAEFLLAVAQLDVRGKTLAALRATSGVVPLGQLQAAEAAFREAEIRLQTAEQALVNLGLPIRGEEVKRLPPEELRRRVQFLGLPESVTKALDPRTASANLIPVASPLDGVVVAREVVAGEVVDVTKVLFVVADVRSMWMTLNLPEEDTRRVALGQPVCFRAAAGGAEVTGSVSWISTAVDEKTRTVRLRADLQDPQRRLRAHTFGRGQVILRQEKSAMVVPSEAVHWDGDCFVVFVRDKNFLAEGAPKVFHVRKVRPGSREEGASTEIIAGVLPGELVATRGSGTLRAELLKNNLGEG
jgi:cobalt-zinc-cadmium efflux system membrane fusion protein